MIQPEQPVQIDIDWGGDQVRFTFTTQHAQFEAQVSADTAEQIGAPLAWAVNEVRRFTGWTADGGDPNRFLTMAKPGPGMDPRAAYTETTRYHQDRHAKAVRELEELRGRLGWLLDNFDPASGADRTRALLGDLRAVLDGTTGGAR